MWDAIAIWLSPAEEGLAGIGTSAVFSLRPSACSQAHLFSLSFSLPRSRSIQLNLAVHSRHLPLSCQRSPVKCVCPLFVSVSDHHHHHHHLCHHHQQCPAFCRPSPPVVQWPHALIKPAQCQLVPLITSDDDDDDDVSVNLWCLGTNRRHTHTHCSPQ